MWDTRFRIPSGLPCAAIFCAFTDNGGHFGFQYHPYCAVKWAILGDKMAAIAR